MLGRDKPVPQAEAQEPDLFTHTAPYEPLDNGHLCQCCEVQKAPTIDAKKFAKRSSRLQGSLPMLMELYLHVPAFQEESPTQAHHREEAEVSALRIPRLPEPLRQVHLISTCNHRSPIVPRQRDNSSCGNINASITAGITAMAIFHGLTPYHRTITAAKIIAAADVTTI
jgi:hypothetical protein